ncbi:MAG: DUF1116 domain-containing protein [Chloroflexi bacterium]|nr:DUF1116 domain-containing protein [Chloroflexota bacterium]
MDLKAKIDAANAEVVKRITSADPVLLDVVPAGQVIPGLTDRMVMHSGPPVTWEKMCGAQRGAVIGMTIFEGWASTPQQAQELLASGAIKFEPNHHHQTVGPMAGTITKSLPVWVVQNRAFGNLAYCRTPDARQQFGDFSEQAIGGIRMWRDVWGPSISKGLQTIKGGLPLKPIIARALQMGDELHNRPDAASQLLSGQLAQAMVRADVAKDALLATLGWTAGNPFMFLGVSMACGKAATDPCAGVEYSTVVTTMARNGTEFGIRVAGLPGEWFTAPSPKIEGLFMPGFSEADAGRDMGDSAITETVGWGGFVIGGAPGILALVGGTAEQALAWSRDMRRITAGTSPDFRIPALNFEGAPVGIDIRKVVQTGILPVIDTAIAHKDPGYPNLGAGIVRPPMDCFKSALRRFATKYGAA